MNIRKTLMAPACAAACLLATACVEYAPSGGYSPGPPSAPPAPPAPPLPPQPQDSRLDALLAPIALYPDPLVALILPASTSPAEISAAAAYLVQYGDATRIDGQPWDPSVRALAHYPTVVTWMSDNMAWTQALGDAFSSSPSEVMASIQRLRARAMASGALVTSAQQLVLSEDGQIEIVPAQPDAIWVPAYDADAVYSDSPYGGPPIDFGPAYPTGIWLSYDLDWRSRAVWVGHPGSRRGIGGWYNPRSTGRPPADASPWHPPSGSRPAARADGRPGGSVVPRPRPIPGAAHAAAPGPQGPNPPPSPQRAVSSPAQPFRGQPPGGREAAPQGSRAMAPARQEPAHEKAAAPDPTKGPKERSQPN